MTLPVLLQRWFSTCLVCVHTLTPRENRERPESGIFWNLQKNTIFYEHPVYPERLFFISIRPLPLSLGPPLPTFCVRPWKHCLEYARCHLQLFCLQDGSLNLSLDCHMTFTTGNSNFRFPLPITQYLSPPPFPTLLSLFLKSIFFRLEGGLV